MAEKDNMYIQALCDEINGSFKRNSILFRNKNILFRVITQADTEESEIECKVFSEKGHKELGSIAVYNMGNGEIKTANVSLIWKKSTKHNFVISLGGVKRGRIASKCRNAYRMFESFIKNPEKDIVDLYDMYRWHAGIAG